MSFQSQNLMAHECDRMCIRDIRTLMIDPSCDQYEKLVVRINERLAHSHLGRDLCKLISTEAPLEIFEGIARLDDHAKARFVSRATTDIAPFSDKHVTKLDARRIERLVSFGLDLDLYWYRMASVAVQDGDAAKLRIALKHVGFGDWTRNSYFHNFYLPPQSPEIASMVADWMADPEKDKERLGFWILPAVGGRSSQDTYTRKSLLCAHVLVPEHIEYLKNHYGLEEGLRPASIGLLLDRLNSNHGRLSIFAHFPTLASVIEASEDEIARVLES
jgi:hypothetical protein